MLSTFGLHTVLALHLHGCKHPARPRINPARLRAAAAATETSVKLGRGRPKKVDSAGTAATAAQQKTEEDVEKYALPLDNAENEIIREEQPHEMKLDSHESLDELQDKSETTMARETGRNQQGTPATPSAPALKPWERMSDEALLAQRRSVEALAAQKEFDALSPQAKWLARKSDTNLHLHRDEAWQELANLFIRHTDKGAEWQDFGGLGRGQLHWYSLRVNSEKSMKNVANFLAQQVTQLSPLEGTSPRDVREFEVWLPSKIIKAYNWRTEKMGNKTVKWRNGQEMLCKCVMDSELNQLITENIYIGGYCFFQNFVDRDGIDIQCEKPITFLSKLCEGSVPGNVVLKPIPAEHTLPEPCSEEYIAEVEAWTKLPETRTKEEVMEEELGEKPVTKPLAEESNRMDTRADIVEVFEDESGKKDSRTGKTQQLRRYKDDAYRGSFSNPSNWYDPETSKAELGNAPAAQPPSSRREISRRDASPAKTQRGAQREAQREVARSSWAAPAALAASQTPDGGTDPAPAQWQVALQQQQQQQQQPQADFQSQLQQQYLPQQEQQYEPQQEQYELPQQEQYEQPQQQYKQPQQQQQQQPQSDYQSQLQKQYRPQQEQQYKLLQQQQYEPQQQLEAQEQQLSQPQQPQSDYQLQLQQQYLPQQEQQYQQWQSTDNNQYSDQRSQAQSQHQESLPNSFASRRQARQESSDPFDSGDSGEWLFSEGEFSEVKPQTAGSIKASTPLGNDDEAGWLELDETAPLEDTSGTDTKAAVLPNLAAPANPASTLGTARPAVSDNKPSMSEDDYWNQFLPAEGRPESIGSAKRNTRSSSSSSSSEGQMRTKPSGYGSGRSARTTAPSSRHRTQQQAAQQPQPEQWQQRQQPSLSKPKRTPSSKVNNDRFRNRAQQYRAAASPSRKPVENRWTDGAAGSGYYNDEIADDWAPGSRQQSWTDEPVSQSSSSSDTNNDWSAWGRPVRQEGEEQGRAQATGSSSPSIPSTDLPSTEESSRTAAAADQTWLPASGPSPFADGGQEDEWGRLPPPVPQQAMSTPHQQDAWSTDAFDFGDIAAPAQSQPQNASAGRTPRRGTDERYQGSVRERQSNTQMPRDNQRSPRNTAGRSSRNAQTRNSGGPSRNAGNNWSTGTGRGNDQPRPDQGFYSPSPDQGVSDSFWDEF